MNLTLPPLSLYIHIPWCVKKCPYCDFNSHALSADIDAESNEALYVEALLKDLSTEIPLASDRELESIFIGGGTPSLFSATAITQLLDGVRTLITLKPGAEITLEANPGAADAAFFAGYRLAGVNRLSIGAQSFNDEHLRSIGRIHSAHQALEAYRLATDAGFHNINLDLMYGLPGQSIGQAMDDLKQAISLKPQHLSWYQLTIETNTLFSSQPPDDLPSHEKLAEISDAGIELLGEHGFKQYEVSAFATGGHQCRHNLNYWQFGDYIGIGAGAHGKLTSMDGGHISRRRKQRSPAAYVESAHSGDALSSENRLQDEDLLLEFMMNVLRLNQGIPAAAFELRTGLSLKAIQLRLLHARRAGLLEQNPKVLRATQMGRTFLNNLLIMFS
ncbi:MAG: radical SAM family heme chaperone HemW [Gammaproteobacteria bacterium]|nr:radical SAM family heme chaperone HemW [Gammaproteobacteria bacterium]